METKEGSIALVYFSVLGKYVWKVVTNGYHCAMETRLFLDLIANANRISVHFCEAAEIDSITQTLERNGVALFEIDGASIRTREDVFKAFAIALKMPKGWYGNEEYAPNIDAFLEYLDDVHEWTPAKGHVVLVRGAEQMWLANARLAGMLVEWWQYATGPQESDIHLVFVW